VYASPPMDRIMRPSIGRTANSISSSSRCITQTRRQSVNWLTTGMRARWLCTLRWLCNLLHMSWAATVDGLHPRLQTISPRGFHDGAFHTARFHSPSGVAATADGKTVYVAVRVCLNRAYNYESSWVPRVCILN
jgi:hypothetical protein